MRKIIKLTESDLTRIVKRIVSEQNDESLAIPLSTHEKLEEIIPLLSQLELFNHNGNTEMFNKVIERIERIVRTVQEEVM